MRAMGMENITAIDLFCGSGAVTEGLKAEGFKILAAIDNDPITCKTYIMNHPEVKLIQSDICLLSPLSLKLELELEGRLDLLVVCAPCQPFSSQNRKRASDDPRSQLFLECIKFIKVFKPRVIFFENVPGIAGRDLLVILESELAKLGYKLGKPRMIDAADCGVPQRRVRCIMVAAQCQSTIDAFYESIRIHPKISVFDAIGHLPPLSSAQCDPDDALHFARRHKSIVLERLRHIPKDGGSRSALPDELELKCHKGKVNDFPDVYGRLKWNDIAPTLTTGCTDVTKGRFAHPRDDRALTLREAAELQSFPKHYKFSGNSGQIARQIGNAVPVKMVRTLAVPITKSVTMARASEMNCQIP